MIKKFDKASIAILTVIAIFAIFALALTAINIATALEEEATTEATVTPEPETITEDQANDISNPSNAEPSLTVSPSIFTETGTYNLDLTIHDFGEYTTLMPVIIYDVNRNRVYEDRSPTEMSGSSYTYSAQNVPVNIKGTYTVMATAVNMQLDPRAIPLEATFELIDYPEPEINLQIDSSISGSAVVGEVNNFTVTLSNLRARNDFGMYLKVRDSNNAIRYFDDSTITPITSTQMTKTFELMPHNTNTWTIEVLIYYIENDKQDLLTTKTVTFNPVENPTPPGPQPDPPGPQPDPDPPAPTPDPGTSGTEGAVTLTSGTPQTADSSLLALLTINLIVLAGLAAFVITRKRIVIIKPKH